MTGLYVSTELFVLIFTRLILASNPLIEWRDKCYVNIVLSCILPSLLVCVATFTASPIITTIPPAWVTSPCSTYSHDFISPCLHWSILPRPVPVLTIVPWPQITLFRYESCHVSDCKPIISPRWESILKLRRCPCVIQHKRLPFVVEILMRVLLNEPIPDLIQFLIHERPWMVVVGGGGGTHEDADLGGALDFGKFFKEGLRVLLQGFDVLSPLPVVLVVLLDIVRPINQYKVHASIPKPLRMRPHDPPIIRVVVTQTRCPPLAGASGWEVPCVVGHAHQSGLGLGGQKQGW